MTSRPWYTATGALCRALGYGSRLAGIRGVNPVQVTLAMFYGLVDLYGIKGAIGIFRFMQKATQEAGKDGESG